ncbi:MAG: hypothetical protein AAGE01_22545 [Pseudomonadota bacterium]
MTTNDHKQVRTNSRRVVFAALLGFVFSSAYGQLVLEASTVSSGAGPSDGNGTLTIQVIAGETAPNRISGGTFTIVGGVQGPAETGTVTSTDLLFSSGFER